MRPADLRPDPGKWKAIALTVLVHVLLIAALVVGIRWQNREAEPVAVEVWREAPAPPPSASTPEPPRIEKPEPPPPPKPDIVIKDEKPAAKKPEPKPAQKPEKLPEPKKPEPPPRPNFDDAIKRDMAQIERDKLLHEQQRRAVEDANALRRAQAEQAAAVRARGLADYVARIRGKVRGNVALPAGVAGNPEAVFEVVQLPSGEVLDVKLKKPSGNAALDDAIERAIYKSSPLPKPPQPELFERVFELRYRPRDE